MQDMPIVSTTAISLVQKPEDDTARNSQYLLLGMLIQSSRNLGKCYNEHNFCESAEKPTKVNLTSLLRIGVRCTDES